jgi:hypothetical protein
MIGHQTESSQIDNIQEITINVIEKKIEILIIEENFSPIYPSIIEVIEPSGPEIQQTPWHKTPLDTLSLYPTPFN